MRIIVFFIFLFTSIYSHGLDSAKAYVTLRDTYHLSMRFTFDSLALLDEIYEGKNQKFDFYSFANLSDEKLKLEFESIKSKVKEIDIRVDTISLESKQFRFIKFTEFQKVVKKEFMNSILDKHKAKNSHKASINFPIFIDGFISKDAKNKVLNISFPKEFGDVLVTFSKPKTELIKPDENSSKCKFVL